MIHDRLLVLCYLLAWVIAFIAHYKKQKSFDAGSFIMLSYAVYAYFSYQLLGMSYSFKVLKFFPFVYLFIMLLVGMLPILKFNTSKGIPIEQPPIKLLNIFCLVFIVSTLFYFPSSVSRITSGFTRLMSDSSYGLDSYNESMDFAADAGHGISNFASIITNAFTQIGLFLTIYYLTHPKGNRWIMIGLFVSSFMKMADGISVGQRGTIVEPLLVLLATYFLLRNYIQKKYTKAIKIMGIVALVILIAPVVMITISRFDTKYSDPRESTYFYLGHANLTFNNYGLDDGGIRYGDRTVSLFKQMLGFRNVPANFIERRAKYPYLKVNDEVFVTYVGDIAIDFGPIMAVIIITLFTIWFTNLTRLRQGRYEFHQLLLVHFVLYMCTIGGIKLFPYSDVSGNLKIIAFILTYFVFKYYNSLQTSK